MMAQSGAMMDERIKWRGFREASALPIPPNDTPNDCCFSFPPLAMFIKQFIAGPLAYFFCVGSCTGVCSGAAIITTGGLGAVGVPACLEACVTGCLAVGVTRAP
ncbi:unnamed protein product, partial [Mesorhabditis spiculigera]